MGDLKLVKKFEVNGGFWERYEKLVKDVVLPYQEKALNDFIEIKGGSSVDEEKIVVQTTPNPEMGDLGVPVFVFAKTLHMAPPQISAEVVKIIKENYSDYAKNCGEFTATETLPVTIPKPFPTTRRENHITGDNSVRNICEWHERNR